MLIEVEDASVSIGGRSVLRNISCVVDSGLITSIVGPSGSGKSTLLNVLGMLKRIDTGKLLIDGNDATRWGDSARVKFWRQNATFVFQDYGLIEDQSLIKNVGIASWGPFGLRPQSRVEIERILDVVGLGGRGREQVSRLSGGEKQRAGIARAIFRRSPVILADEPTASLDRANRQLVVDLLRSEAERGASVVIASHDDETIAACDRRIVLTAAP